MFALLMINFHKEIEHEVSANFYIYPILKSVVLRFTSFFLVFFFLFFLAIVAWMLLQE